MRARADLQLKRPLKRTALYPSFPLITVASTKALILTWHTDLVTLLSLAKKTNRFVNLNNNYSLEFHILDQKAQICN